MAVTSFQLSSIKDGQKFKSFGGVFGASGGSEVKIVGGFRYHMFDASSQFVVSGANRSVEILVIGAGGGGGFGGGGGAGAKEPASGYTTQTLSAGSYTVTIASGGASIAAGVFNSRGGTPSATSFNGTSLVSALGGGGGGANTDGVRSGSNGGSGGGGGSAGAAGVTGGVASGSNTNAGGNGNISSPNFPGGGGGGATAAGQNAPSGTQAGNGGAGLTLTNIDANLTSANFTTFSGMTVISSGGGGGSQGGTAGTGGTGAGNGSNSDSTAGGNATSFGSGGGGAGYTSSGGASGNGFKGLVIVRYAV